MRGLDEDGSARMMLLMSAIGGTRSRGLVGSSSQMSCLSETRPHMQSYPSVRPQRSSDPIFPGGFHVHESYFQS